MEKLVVTGGAKEYLVIHHTATRDDLTAEQMKLSMQRTYIDNRWFTRIPTNYIVDKRGNYVVVNPIDMDVWACRKDNYNTLEQVIDCNSKWIHIELVGNFNNHKPTQQQYEAINKIYKELWSKLIFKWHSDFQRKNCPWKYFDWEKMMKIIKPVTQKPKISNDWTITFSLSRYYSPIQWQSRYYNGKTYEQDVIMNCGANAIGNDWCLYTASWIQYTNEHKNKSVSCPSNIPLWSKIELQLKDWPHIVTCEDRGGAIINNRLDMYCGIWEYALDNWSTCITGKVKWKIIAN